ncbi:MAG TPA: hypothetical protein VFA89_11655 [Terriglobales bacterium]|nr:hypothetical protein [Terriglobales bacterium]
MPSGDEDSIRTWSGPPPVVLTPKVEWGQALPAAASAGLIAALTMLAPFGLLGLGIIAAGFLSIRFYRRRMPGLMLTTGAGARVGALTGVLGFCMFILFTSLQISLSHSGGMIRAALIDALEKSAQRSADPQAQAALAQLKTPEGLAFMMAMGLLVMLMGFVVFGTVGGAAAVMLKNREGRRDP